MCQDHELKEAPILEEVHPESPSHSILDKIVMY